MSLDETGVRELTLGGEPPPPADPPVRVRLRRRRAAGAVAILVLVAVVIGVGIRIVSDGGGGTGHAAIPQPVAPRLTTPPATAHYRHGALTAMYRRLLAVTPIIVHAGAQHREVALTFDDGPGPYTPQVLDVLERYHAPATFFEVGFMVRFFAVSTRRELADGDALGNHTAGHRDLSRLSHQDQLTQIDGAAAALLNQGVSTPRLFRPPYGGWSADTLPLLRAKGMLMILWSVESGDYARPGTAVIIRNVLRHAAPGAIILLHDAGGDRSQTVAALPVIITALRSYGYELVTVPRLLLDNPPPRIQPFPPGGFSRGG
jgi:peptidoglycan-N-acetylglucosamine deacetylase